VNGVTDRAGVHLFKLLEDSKTAREQAVRYEAANGTAELRLDSQDPLDLAFEYAGRVVLIADMDTAEAVTGRKLDYEDGRFFLT